MKIFVPLPLFALVAGCVSTAQEFPAPPPPPPGADVVYAQTGAAVFNAQQLEQLLAPVALYPDALLALMLSASTNYPDLAQAAQFLATGGSVNEVEVQPWEDSVRALGHYPQVVRWMADNPAWTQQLGDAFVAQPDNVMSAVQRLRARARAAGTLVDTPQQVVVYEGDTIAIEPANPDVIYVPYYDPTIVYDRPYAYMPGGYFSYSPAFVTGWWLSFGVDWHRRHVWEVDRGERERWWRDHRRDWNRPRPPQHQAPEIHPWRPRTDLRSRRDEPGHRWSPPPGANRDRHDNAPGPDHGRGTDHPRDAGSNRGPDDHHDADRRHGPDSRRDGGNTQGTTVTPTPTANPSANRAPAQHPWRTGPTTTPAAPTTTAAPVPSVNPATTTPAPVPPRGGWRRDHGGGSVYNPNAPRSTPANRAAPPSPSAALPVNTNVPGNIPATAPRAFPTPPPSAPTTTQGPPQHGGWRPTAPAGQPGGHHFTPPPSPPPGPAPAPQQSSPPPTSDGNGRPGQNRDRER